MHVFFGKRAVLKQDIQEKAKFLSIHLTKLPFQFQRIGIVGEKNISCLISVLGCLDAKKVTLFFSFSFCFWDQTVCAKCSKPAPILMVF